MVNNRGQVHTLDAIAALALILMTTISILFIQQLHVARIYKALDEVLGALCKDECFIQAVYSLNSSRLEALLNAYLGSTPYNLTTHDIHGDKLLSIGQPIEGLASVIILPGIDGILNPLIICLKVKGVEYSLCLVSCYFRHAYDRLRTKPLPMKLGNLLGG
ncbi:MAG: hypothetical protein DRN15_06325 [Thermoprotei archaeon]|nr:MAG: hypothetical protein DRZ82_09635 [Thermoprotei archaeon]RLF23433.1 MAG: hypothetical protein DRN15_06325 [Thermoprotei archaeon]